MKLYRVTVLEKVDKVVESEFVSLSPTVRQCLLSLSAVVTRHLPCARHCWVGAGDTKISKTWS